MNSPSEMTLNERIEATNPHAESVTNEGIDRQIVGVYYSTADKAVGVETQHADRLALVTLCFLALRNGFTIIGKSACVDPAKYDEAIGRELAYKDARNQIGQLEGYNLATRLLDGG